MLCASPPSLKNSLLPSHILTVPQSFLLKITPLQNLYRVKCCLKDSSINRCFMAVTFIKNGNKMTTPSPRFVKDRSSCHSQSKSETETQLITFCQIYYFQLCGHFQPSTSRICFSLLELGSPFCQMWLKYSMHLLHQVSTAEVSWLIKQLITVVWKSVRDLCCFCLQHRHIFSYMGAILDAEIKMHVYV